MRDPSLTLGPDGTFHLVWTTAWRGNAVGYASSRNLISWSEQRALRVMAHEPNTLNCWAPELVYHERSGVWLLFWASSVDGAFEQTARSSEEGLNHRMYVTSTADFVHFAETRLLHDPGFSAIDGTLLRPGAWSAMAAAAGEGPAADATAAANTGLPAEELLWIVKDDTKYPQPRKHLRVRGSNDSLHTKRTHRSL